MGKIFPLALAAVVLAIVIVGAASCSACIIGTLDHAPRESSPRLRVDGGAE